MELFVGWQYGSIRIYTLVLRWLGTNALVWLSCVRQVQPYQKFYCGFLPYSRLYLGSVHAHCSLSNKTTSFTSIHRLWCYVVVVLFLSKPSRVLTLDTEKKCTCAQLLKREWRGGCTCASEGGSDASKMCTFSGWGRCEGDGISKWSKQFVARTILKWSWSESTSTQSLPKKHVRWSEGEIRSTRLKYLVQVSSCFVFTLNLGWSCDSTFKRKVQHFLMETTDHA